ncbi:unnamed protein product, partial [Closterium sp. NIES-54]
EAPDFLLLCQCSRWCTCVLTTSFPSPFHLLLLCTSVLLPFRTAPRCIASSPTAGSGISALCSPRLSPSHDPSTCSFPIASSPTPGSGIYSPCSVHHLDLCTLSPSSPPHFSSSSNAPPSPLSGRHH